LQFKGKVVDPFGVALPGVAVKINSLKLQVLTDKSGAFAFKNLPQGKYAVKFSLIGFQPKDTLINFTESIDNLDVALEINNVMTDEVVVTGTRTIKEIENNPIPTQVVTKEEINKTGYVRLDEILSEINGINVVEFLGKGVQIQGLDESYALILINGEPIIGTMSGGQINIDRLAVGNVSRVEIVKGPASSLYGSAALAGVINLITTESPNSLDIRSSSRYGSYNTLDISTDVKYSSDNDKIGINLFADVLRSDGYKVNESTVRKTIPDYFNYTIAGDIFYNFNKSTQAILRGRINKDMTQNQFLESSGTIKDEEANLNDQNFSLTLKHRYSKNASVKSIFYYTSYDAETIFLNQGTNDIFHYSFYNQDLAKIEFQWDLTFGASHLLTIGTGGNFESVDSDIIIDSTANSKAFFAFAQHDWIITDKINLISSLRYDDHSNYTSSLNPKIAISYELFPKFSLKANVGSGFKAPSPENLFLNWTNPTEGYSVFGVTGIVDKLNELKNQGLITDFLIDLNKIKDLKPEHSISFNFGASYEIMKNLNSNFNLFRNEVSDMIEWQVVAMNQDTRQKYFTYFNLRSVYTQGIEANLSYKLFFSDQTLENINNASNSSIDFNIGYQYLETADRDVLEQIKNSKIWKVGSNGIPRPVQEVEYGGLFNRSKHSLTVKIKYDNPDWGFSAFLRGSIRSKFGISDINGNNILDDEKEYINAYQLWNLTLTQKLPFDLISQFAINNIMNTKAKDLLITPGRTFFVSLIYNFNKK
jgi:outer membrane receptor for ferrienterochelin and colicins